LLGDAIHSPERAMAKGGKKADAGANSKAERSVARAMHEFKEGTLKSGGSGKRVTNPKQAVAIGLSEARSDGTKVPRRPRAKKT
jgi:hypothetical protein